MKRIKILLIVCAVFLFSGCSVNYNINIDKENSTLCSEKLTIKGFDSSVVGTSFEEFTNSIYWRVLGDYEIDQNDKNNIIVNKNSCNIYDLSNSKLLEKYIISSEFSDGYISIVFDEEELGDLIKANNGETAKNTGLIINISINVPYKVTKTNATKTDGNNYMWKFDKDNEIKDIIIEYNTSKKSIRLSSMQLTIVSIGAILGMIVLTILFVYIKHKAVNS